MCIQHSQSAECVVVIFNTDIECNLFTINSFTFALWPTVRWVVSTLTNNCKHCNDGLMMLMCCVCVRPVFVKTRKKTKKLKNVRHIKRWMSRRYFVLQIANWIFCLLFFGTISSARLLRVLCSFSATLTIREGRRRIAFINSKSSTTELAISMCRNDSRSQWIATRCIASCPCVCLADSSNKWGIVADCGYPQWNV